MNLARLLLLLLLLLAPKLLLLPAKLLLLFSGFLLTLLSLLVNSVFFLAVSFLIDWFLRCRYQWNPFAVYSVFVVAHSQFL